MREIPCASRHGTRLKPEALAVKIADRSIAEVAELALDEAADFLSGLELSGRDAAVAAQVMKEINARLGFLLDVGLEYLSLNRAAGTLSGGEARRIRLATQIGSGLVGVLYVLDEPSIGLHQRDNRRLIDTLIKLKDLGNTLIVVEHDEDTIAAADWIVDIGPGAGEHGERSSTPVPCPGSRTPSARSPGPTSTDGRRSPSRRRAARSTPNGWSPSRRRVRTTSATSPSPSPSECSPPSPASPGPASRRSSTRSSTRRWPTSSTAPPGCPVGTSG